MSIQITKIFDFIIENKKLVFVVIIAILFLFFGVVFYSKKKIDSLNIMTIKRGDIVEFVSASGKVEAPTKIDLHFKNSYVLTALYAKVGKKVEVGEVLAKQDTRQFDTQVSEIQADINLQKARLNQLLGGASNEDITVAESSVNSASVLVKNEKKLLDNAKQNAVYTLKDSYTKSDDAIRNGVDQLFVNAQSNNPKLVFSTNDSKLQGEVELARFSIENIIKSWNISTVSLLVSSNISESFILAKNNLEKIRIFLDKVALIVNDSNNKPSDISQTTWDTWRSNVATSRSTINTALYNISASEENISIKESSVVQAEASLQTAKEQLVLKKAPTRSTDINVYQAQIDQALASMKRIQAERKDYILISPTNGIVTNTIGEIGEIVTPEVPVVSILSGGKLQIKLNIIEDNIVNVKVGQEVDITLDAVPNKKFLGTVVNIDPAETTINGAVYYQATVLFNNEEDFIRSGMTANVLIKTAISKNTLFIPISAIFNKDGKKFVKIVEGNTIIDREVMVGLKNNNGMVEIISSGLNEDQHIILGGL